MNFQYFPIIDVAKDQVFINAMIFLFLGMGIFTLISISFLWGISLIIRINKPFILSAEELKEEIKGEFFARPVRFLFLTGIKYLENKNLKIIYYSYSFVAILMSLQLEWALFTQIALILCNTLMLLQTKYSLKLFFNWHI